MKGLDSALHDPLLGKILNFIRCTITFPMQEL